MNRLVHLAMLCCIIGLVSSCEKAPLLTLNCPSNISFPVEGGSQTVSFSTNRDWKVSSSESWCTVSPSSGVSGQENSTFKISCDRNTSYDTRVCTITITAEELIETITVSQDAVKIIVSQNLYTLSSGAQQLIIGVSSNVSYLVSSDAEWLSVTNEGASERVVVNVLENDDTENYRIGHISLSQVGGDLKTVVTIAQDKAHSGIFYSKEPHFSESIDLLSLIWRLAGAPEYNACRITKVSESADAFFASMKDHKAVRLAKEYRKNGVSYDAVATYGLYLLITDDGSIVFNPFFDGNDNANLKRWPGNSKEDMLVALNDFYKKSNFHEWYQSLEPLHQQAVDSFKSKFNVDYEWYDHFFGPVDNLSTQIILSFLNGPSNYGLSTELSSGGKLHSPVIGCISQDSNGNIYYSDILSVIIHEFCHPYCNPLVNKYWESMKDKANALFPKVESLMKSQAYSNAKIMMYETLVRVCTIRYLLSHGYSKYKERLITSEESMGFLMVRSLVEALEKREQNWAQYPTLDDFMPEIVKAINDCQL